MTPNRRGHMASYIERRKFLATLGGAAAWPRAARAQQPAMPVIGFLAFGALDTSVLYLAAFRKDLNEIGFVEGQNVAIEYRWAEGRYDRMPELAADLIRRRVVIIAIPGSPPTVVRAVQAATSAIPIVFGVGDDPVKVGLVARLSRPGGHATGINFFTAELVAKAVGTAARAGARGFSHWRARQSGRSCYSARRRTNCCHQQQTACSVTCQRPKVTRR